jgi:hypothetical protein
MERHEFFNPPFQYSIIPIDGFVKSRHPVKPDPGNFKELVPAFAGMTKNMPLHGFLHELFQIPLFFFPSEGKERFMYGYRARGWVSPK